MSAPKFTPGPWIVRNSTDVFTTSRRGNTMDGHQVADCTCDFDAVDDLGLSFGEQRMNAHLVAAAPDLHALAVKVAEHFKDTDAPLGIEARAVLAKAVPQ